MSEETTPILKADPATSGSDNKDTDVGSVFVSNYPPYSFWSEDKASNAISVLNSPGDHSAPLGLYMHIPFCRKRCKFCYFKVYTGKNSSEIQNYLDALAAEIELYAQVPAVANRKLDFIYFGGGTPSFISVKHLQELVGRAKAAMSWDSAREIAFECEPGTLTQSKLEAIREIGVTRLSIGVEHFDDRVLEENGRAHVSKEIYRVHPWIKALDFDQINIDLIAGMVGDTWDTWKDTVKKAIDFDADSITIYQLELPYNAVYSQALRAGKTGDLNFANWKTKREWHAYAIEQFESAGYVVSSAYTMLKADQKSNFVYRDSLWRGADMLPTGVASFGHMSGVHFQNHSSWKHYLGNIENGNLPVNRAYQTTSEERLVREMILQLKLGTIKTAYFYEKFNVNIMERFAPQFSQLQEEGWLNVNNDTIDLTRDGLLRVDRLLPSFYAEQYRNSRYT